MSKPEGGAAPDLEPPDSEARPIQPANQEEILSLHDDNPLLNYEALKRARDAMFKGRQNIPRKDFLRFTKEAYKGLSGSVDMEKYARLHNFSDGVMLAEHFRKAAVAAPKHLKTDRILVIGCGDGRLSEIFIELARQNGVKEIIQNDLIAEHLEKTRAKIQTAYGNDGSNADGVQIQYVAGDILDANIPGGAVDAAYMLWYVSAEFCDPSSKKNMRKTRDNTYKKIHDLLIPGGAMVEDSPDQNHKPGFYHVAVAKTAHLLREAGILPGEEENLMLSNWESEQEDGFPYQLRYIPKNGTDNTEKTNAGFILRSSKQEAIPKKSAHPSAKPVEQTLHDVSDPEEAHRLLMQTLNTTVTFPDMSDPTQKRRIIRWWERKK